MAPKKELSDREFSLINFHVIQDTLLYLSRVTQHKNWGIQQDVYAEGLVIKAGLQMLTIRNILEVGEWDSQLDGRKHHYLIDPLAVATVLRGAYECMLTLNHVYVNSASKEEVELRYILWALSTYISKDRLSQARSKKTKKLVNRSGKKLNRPSTICSPFPLCNHWTLTARKSSEKKLDRRLGRGGNTI